MRGAIPLGYGEGTRAEYSLYVTNGPRFASDVRGAFFATNNTDQNRAKGYGARLGFELLPYDAGLGRLRLGASTFDGQWGVHSKLWFTSWGIDSVYQNGPVALRGEYLQTHRDMPTGLPDDRRDLLRLDQRALAKGNRIQQNTSLIGCRQCTCLTSITQSALYGTRVRTRMPSRRTRWKRASCASLV